MGQTSVNRVSHHIDQGWDCFALSSSARIARTTAWTVLFVQIIADLKSEVIT